MGKGGQGKLRKACGGEAHYNTLCCAFLHHTPPHCTTSLTTLLFIALHFAKLHSTDTALHYTSSLHHTTLRYSTAPPLHHTTLQYTTLDYSTPHHTALHHTPRTPLCYTPLLHTTPHYAAHALPLTRLHLASLQHTHYRRSIKQPTKKDDACEHSAISEHDT